MGLNLGAAVSGYMGTKKQLDDQDAQDRVNTLRDQAIDQGKRSARAVADADKYLKGVGQDDAPKPAAPASPVAAGVNLGAQSPATPAAPNSVAEAAPVQDQAARTQPFRPLGTPPGPAPAAGQPQSLSPLVAALGTQPEQAGGGAAPARLGPAAGVMAAASGQDAGIPEMGSLPAHLTRYQRALQAAANDGNMAAVENLTARYTKVLADHIKAGDDEFHAKVAPLVRAGAQDKAVQDLVGAHMSQRMTALGSALLALKIDPGSESTQALVKRVFGQAGEGAAGIKYVPDVDASGKTTQMMAVIVDKEGNPVMQPDGKPFARPADMVNKLMLQAPGGAILAPQMQKWGATSSDGRTTLYQEQTLAGQTPRTVSVGPNGPTMVDERRQNMLRQYVNDGVGALDKQLLNAGPMTGLGNVKQEYAQLYNAALARLEELVNQQHSTGGPQAVRPQAAADQVFQELARAVAIQKADPAAKPQLGGAAGAGGQPATAADVAKKLGF